MHVSVNYLSNGLSICLSVYVLCSLSIYLSGHYCVSLHNSILFNAISNDICIPLRLQVAHISLTLSVIPVVYPTIA